MTSRVVAGWGIVHGVDVAVGRNGDRQPGAECRCAGDQRGYVTWQQGSWQETVRKDELYKSYLEFAESRRERHPLSREKLGAL